MLRGLLLMAIPIAAMALVYANGGDAAMEAHKDVLLPLVLVLGVPAGLMLIVGRIMYMTARASRLFRMGAKAIWEGIDS